MMKKNYAFRIIVFSSLLFVIACQNSNSKEAEESQILQQVSPLESISGDIKYLLVLNNNECINCCISGMEFLTESIAENHITKQNTLVIIPKERKVEIKKFLKEEPFFSEHFSIYTSDSLFYSATTGVSVFLNIKKDTKYMFKSLSYKEKEEIL